MRSALVFTHRWSALLLGVALLLVVISGVVLLYEQEIDRAVHPELYRTTDSANPISHAEAAEVVRRELPSSPPADVVDSHGVYLVYIDDYERQAFVDPGSGRLLGVDDTRDGVMGFLYNLHLCGLSCVWWPGIRRLARGLRVRRARRAGRLALCSCRGGGPRPPPLLRTDRRGLLAAAVSVELAGVLAVGMFTLADPAAFPDETVWSRFGQGYAFLPLVLPVLALAWLRASRPPPLVAGTPPGQIGYRRPGDTCRNERSRT